MAVIQQADRKVHYDNCKIGDMETHNKVSDERVEKLIKLQLLRFARKRRLLCKNGYYVEVCEDGTVRGTSNGNSPWCALQILSIGSDMLAIWGTNAGRYIAISPDGKVHTTDTEGRHCVLIESVSPEFYNIYESYHSVYNGDPRCLLMRTDGTLEMGSANELPGRNGQFIWQITS